MRWWRNPWGAAGGGVAAGLSLAASLPPLGWWPLAPVGVALLALLLGGGWPVRLAASGAAGLALYGPGLWWATEFHFVGWVVLVVFQAALLAAVLAAVPPGRVTLALPAALVVAEALRAAWPFGGLPLAGLALGQAGGPLVEVARLGGHLLVVGALAAAGVGLAGLARRRPAEGAAVLAGVVVVTAGGWVAPDGSPAGTLPAAAVQGGGPRGVRAVDTDPSAAFEAQVAATAGVAPGTRLVLWPEDVVDVSGEIAGSPEEAVLAALARDLGATLVVGVVEDDPGGRRFRNAALVWDPAGAVVDRYDKVHRVPFGEYVPLRGLIGRVADVSNVPRDAVAGRGPGTLDTPLGRLGVLISFEVFFADRARAAAASGGRILLVPTNASSYTTAQVPAQEVAAARLRAVETGRWVLQAAPTGYSAAIDHRGRIVSQGPLGERAVVASDVGLRTGTTVSTALGGLVLPLVAAAGLVLAWFRKENLSG